jgi:hypothetical protein
MIPSPIVEAPAVILALRGPLNIKVCAQIGPQPSGTILNAVSLLTKGECRFYHHGSEGRQYATAWTLIRRWVVELGRERLCAIGGRRGTIDNVRSKVLLRRDSQRSMRYHL